MAVSFLNSRTISVGPVRLIRMRISTAGSSETFTVPVYAASSSAHRGFALTRTPLTDGSSDATIRPTSTTREQLVCTIDGGASGDQFSFGIWSW